VPTYDYQCNDCGKTYEVRQPISASPLTSCQFCGGAIRRLLSSAPFILKGGGWYVTDYPSESRKKAMAAERKSAEPATSAKTAASGSDGSSSATSTPAPSSSSSETSSSKTSSTTS
jgi:putative FmdB family regulatory protein